MLLALFAQGSGDTPVFFWHKGTYPSFAVTDQAECNRLNTASTGARLNTSPEQGTDFITNQAIKYAACLLGVEKVFIDRSRLLNGILDSPLGDFIEDCSPWVL